MNMNANELPRTMIEAVRRFSDLNYATEFFAKLRWPTGVCCPHCGSLKVDYLPKRRVWQCRENHAKSQFSVKIGTVFEECRLPIDKCLIAIWLEVNAKNSISSCEVARALDVTQKTAWFLLHRIRLALHVGSFDKLTGEVEADESYIGGLARNMHRSRLKTSGIKGGGGSGKAIVHGILQRGDKKAKQNSKVVASVIPNTKLNTLLPIVRAAVKDGSNLYTDTAAAYASRQFAEAFIHEMVDHAEMYVKDRCHTNGLENFWSLFKRCIKGTHVSVEPFHLAAYLDSESFRFNNREINDGGRFIAALRGTSGKRLTYKALIGDNSVPDGYLSSENIAAN